MNERPKVSLGSKADEAGSTVAVVGIVKAQMAGLLSEPAICF